ncbi:MAG: LON peptidase substrate-binding domain-containing protein [Spirochaetes bacterium]|nr:LON peptidase substrate-binding domain-containing protein [Spirochaetota bacterium]
MQERRLKIFYLKRKVIFPYCTLAVFVKQTEESGEIRKGDRILAYAIRSTLDLIFYRNKLATLSEVLDAKIDKKMIKIMLKGLERVKLKKLVEYRHAEFEFISPSKTEQNESVMDELRKRSQELIFLINVEESDKLIKLLNYIVDLNQMTDFIANYFIMNFRTRRRLYNITDAHRRALLLISELEALIRRLTKKRKEMAI